MAGQSSLHLSGVYSELDEEPGRPDFAHPELVEG